MMPLNETFGSIQNIKSIRLEPSIPGKRVGINSITINYNQSVITIQGLSPTSYTINASSNALGDNNVFPNYTLNSDANPFIEITFPNPIFTAQLILKADIGKIDAVGMKVLLFDAAGKLVSNRVTTHTILDPTIGCALLYNTVNMSNS